MIKVGIAGIGFMGWIHYLAYQQVARMKVRAVCTRSRKKLAGDWRDIKGNFGPGGTKVDLAGIATYSQFDELLADPELELIDICLPPHLHAEAAIKALESGKHVFCEKPMALTGGDCRRMVRAAEKAGRQIMVGHVLPFFPEYAHAVKAAKSGRYGKLLGGHFKREIAHPQWSKDYYDPALVGGPLLDLQVHDAHFIRLLFGMPTALVSQGRERGKVVEYCSTLFRFNDPSIAVSANGGVINQQGRSFTHGFEIHLEEATLQYEFAVVGDKPELLMPLTMLGDKGKVLRPGLGGGDPVVAFVAELREVAKSLRTGLPSSILSGDLARDAIVLCHKQSESVKKNRPIKLHALI